MTISTRTALAAALLTAASILPAGAQTNSACGADPAAWLATHSADIDGFWTAQSQAFIINGEDTGMNFTQAVSVTPVPNGIRLEGAEFEQPITVTLTDTSFDLAPPRGVTGLGAEDFELLIGCEADRLPRLLSQETMVLDGVPAEVTYTALIAGTNAIYFWFGMSTSYGDLMQFWILDQ